MGFAETLFRKGFWPVVAGARMLALAAGGPLANAAVGAAAESVKDRLAGHFQTGKRLEEAFTAALKDAEAVTRSWIEGGHWIDAQWMREIHQAAGDLNLQEFCRWLRPQVQNNEQLRPFAQEHMQERAIQTRLFADLGRLCGAEAQLRLAMTSSELTQFLSEMLSESGSRSTRLDMPADTLLHYAFEFRKFDVLAESFARAFEVHLSRDPQFEPFFAALQRTEVMRQQMNLFAQIKRVAEQQDENALRVCTHLTTLLKEVEQIKKCVEEDFKAREKLSRSLEPIQNVPEALIECLRENSRMMQESTKRLEEHLEQVRSSPYGASKELQNEIIETAEQLFRSPPVTERVVSALQSWTHTVLNWQEYEVAAKKLDDYLGKYGKKAPPELFHLCYLAFREWGNRNYYKKAADYYNQAVERDPKCAEFPTHYKVSKLLGRGAFGAVFLVQNQWGVEYALKTLEPMLGVSYELDFEREARNQTIAARNDPTGVVARIHDFNAETQGNLRPYLVLDYVNGKTLDELYRDPPRMRKLLQPETYVRRLGVIYKVLRVMAYLHARKEPIIHRDLHPGNLMITYSGAVRLIDFGIAKMIPKTQEGLRSYLTVLGQTNLGTVEYAAPEFRQGRTECQQNPQLDVFSLGRIALFLLTGNPESRLENLQSDNIREVLRRATEIEFENRQANARVLRDEFFEAAIRDGATAADLDLSDRQVRQWCEIAYPGDYPDPEPPAGDDSAGGEQTVHAVEGLIEAIDEEGVIVRAEGKTYRVYRDEVSWSREFKQARQFLAMGQKITVCPKELNTHGQDRDATSAPRPASIREAAENPWKTAKERFGDESAKTVPNAKVEGTTTNKAVVALEEGLHGLTATISRSELYEGPSILLPNHWLHPGDRIDVRVLDVVVEADQREIRASHRVLTSDAVQRWRERLKRPAWFRGVVARVTDSKISVVLGSEVSDPIAEHRDPIQFAQSLGLEEASDALGRHVNVTVEERTSRPWPAAHLTVTGLRAIPDADQPRLEMARVVEIDPLGHYLIVDLVDHPNRQPGRVLARDFQAVLPDEETFNGNFQGAVEVGDEFQVRRIRQRPGGLWDYCAPNIWREPFESWLPGGSELVPARVTLVQPDCVYAQLRGGVTAAIPASFLRAKSQRERRQPFQHLRTDHFFHAGEEVEGYVVGVEQEDHRVVFCPQWSHDTKGWKAYLRQTYRAGSKHFGAVAWTTMTPPKRIFVLLEPGIEAAYEVRSGDELDLDGEDFEALRGCRVEVVCGDVPPRGPLALTALELQ